MIREEYLKIKENNEREIVHWQARTTETQKAAIEFQVCMNAINQMVELWDTQDDEDRQDMAHMLFEYLVYDLDQRRIVDFRLKSWADRYFILRAEMYGDLEEQQAEEKKMLSVIKDSTVLCPIGESNSCFCLERAMS